MIEIGTSEAKRAAFGKEMNGIFNTAGSLPFCLRCGGFGLDIVSKMVYKSPI
jgi:hypothetical protein